MGKDLTKKERMKIPRTPMREQPPDERNHNFTEVNLGYTAELAKLEALRCLQCPKPKCVAGCPVGISIHDFIQSVADGRFDEAARILKADNALPAVCGRVCPQEEQCEVACVLAKKGDSVAIGHLERFVADFEREHGNLPAPTVEEKTGKQVAIVGSGPAGLSCANDLIRKGHDVVVFEALH